MHSLLIPTPFGPLFAEASAVGIGSVRLLVLAEGFTERPSALLKAFARKVDRYFSGKPELFLDISLDYRDAQPQRQDLYEVVRRIPYGQTRAYGEVGRLCGLSHRGAGAGMRACPFFLLIPAQRVIYADGSIGGFGGREGLKEQLLRLEKAI